MKKKAEERNKYKTHIQFEIEFTSLSHTTPCPQFTRSIFNDREVFAPNFKIDALPKLIFAENVFKNKTIQIHSDYPIYTQPPTTLPLNNKKTKVVFFLLFSNFYSIRFTCVRQKKTQSHNFAFSLFFESEEKNFSFSVSHRINSRCDSSEKQLTNSNNVRSNTIVHES